MSERVKSVLDALARVDGVEGAMIVDAEVGVPVASQLRAGVEETALSAMSGALFTRTAEASRTAGLGALNVLQLEGEGGHVVVAGAGALLVVALTASGARLGMVRVEAERAAGRLSE